MTWLEQSLAFYASYHNEERNKYIHFMFVWPIFFTAQVFLHNAGSLPNGFADIIPGFHLTWCALLSLFYGIYYFLIEQPGLAGPLASGLVTAGFFATKTLNEANPEFWKLALGLHIFSWAAQIFGHQVFEQRSPAFLDNIVQALVMAPLFVVLEILFLFGYKEQLHKKVSSIAKQNIAHFRLAQANAKKGK
ncbi:DUF962 domain-containing protein [archaeon]|nr:MAG: DUF962 domain-containing protein [archaeon]